MYQIFGGALLDGVSLEVYEIFFEVAPRRERQSLFFVRLTAASPVLTKKDLLKFGKIAYNNTVLLKDSIMKASREWFCHIWQYKTQLKIHRDERSYLVKRQIANPSKFFVILAAFMLLAVHSVAYGQTVSMDPATIESPAAESS